MKRLGWVIVVLVLMALPAALWNDTYRGLPQSGWMTTQVLYQVPTATATPLPVSLDRVEVSLKRTAVNQMVTVEFRAPGPADVWFWAGPVDWLLGPELTHLQPTAEGGWYGAQKDAWYSSKPFKARFCVWMVNTDNNAVSMAELPPLDDGVAKPCSEKPIYTVE